MNELRGKLAFLFVLTIAALVLCPQSSNSEGNSDQSPIAQKPLSKRVGSGQPHKISKFSGEKTTLVLDAEFWIPRHDVDDYGHTAISLLSKDGKVLFKKN